MNSGLTRQVSSGWQSNSSGSQTSACCSFNQNPLYSNEVSPMQTEWIQVKFKLPPAPLGCHLITELIYRAVPEIAHFEVGTVQIFLQHTTASLSLNECPSALIGKLMHDQVESIMPPGHGRSVLQELNSLLVHIKSSLIGQNVSVPVSRGRLAFGACQGIYLHEHKHHGGARSVIVTIHGQKRSDGRTYKLPWQ